MSFPAPPTIVINGPVTANSPLSALHDLPATILERVPPPEHYCYLCDEQNPRDFSRTTKFLDTCLLCSRHFCPIHKSQQWESVCNTNHAKYYRDCLDKARNQFALRSSDGSVNSYDVEEALVREGIYPSLGERERAIFKTRRVSEDTMREIEELRTLGAEQSGNKGRRPASLISEKDAVGADIAI